MGKRSSRALAPAILGWARRAGKPAADLAGVAAGGSAIARHQSAHGEAAADASRALDPAEGQAPERNIHGHARGERNPHYGRWQQRVGDVMTTSVVTVDRRTPYKQIAALLAQHQISAMPVLVLGVTAKVRNGIVTLAGLLGSAEEHDLIRVAGRLTWDVDGVVDVVNHLGATQPVTSPAPRHSDTPVMAEEFLELLTKPEELVGRLAKPGEFIASAYDFAEQMLTSQRKLAEGMVEATKPLLGGTEGTGAKKGRAKKDG